MHKITNQRDIDKVNKTRPKMQKYPCNGLKKVPASVEKRHHIPGKLLVVGHVIKRYNTYNC